MTKLCYLEIIRVEDTLTGFFFKECKKYHTGSDKWFLWPRVLANGTKGMDGNRVKDKAIGLLREM